MAAKKNVKLHSKGDFEAMVAEKASISKAQAHQAVNAFIDSITEVVKKGEAVSFTGFGKFEVTDRAAREGRNPKTGEAMQIKASKVAKFSAGKLLKEAANSK